MNKVTMRGSVGEFRWSYHRAGEVRGWELFGTTLTATLVKSDTYRLSQAPLVFVVPRANGEPWRWPIRSLKVDGQSVTATVFIEEA